jgi:hypothetical protein
LYALAICTGIFGNNIGGYYTLAAAARFYRNDLFTGPFRFAYFAGTDNRRYRFRHWPMDTFRLHCPGWDAVLNSKKTKDIYFLGEKLKTTGFKG